MKNIVCVFAHPDDEAFGPAGTIAKLSKKYNVYLLCVTRGDAGKLNQKAKGKIINQNLKVHWQKLEHKN